MVGLFRRSQESGEKAEEALERTRRTWFGKVAGLFERPRIDQELWEELEELLIGSDTGVATTRKILERLQQRVEEERLHRPEAVRDALKEELVRMLEVDEAGGYLWGKETSTATLPRPAIILVVGVNGTGKTTSIAKLAYAYRADGETAIIAAADTFRAAAIEQLKALGEMVDSYVVAHRPGADPGAVVYDALTAAESRSADAVIIDTAGRLHTKVNLMEELRKIQRVIQRRHPEAPHEVLLILDATTGQNGLAQAEAFAEAVDVTAVCLTKLDGTSKGGIVFAVCDQLGIPVRFVGTGERPEDLSPFSPRRFVDALFL